MNNNDFRGVNADYLEQYVQLKRSLGYQYDAQRAVLLYLIDLLLKIRSALLD